MTLCNFFNILDPVLDAECIKDVDVMLKYKVATREIENRVFNQTGKNIIAKDIQNRKAIITPKKSDLNNISETINLLQKYGKKFIFFVIILFTKKF